MEFTGIKYYPISELRPSQLYLSREKIKAIEEWFDPDDMKSFSPLPVHDFGNGQYTLTDGHTRAYVLYKNGLSHAPIIYDNDDIVAGETGMKLYAEDIVWCERFGIKSVRDLSMRILPADEYQRYWIRRCDRSYHLLTQISVDERKQLQSKVSGLYLYGVSAEMSEFYFENIQGELFVFRNDILIPENGE